MFPRIPSLFEKRAVIAIIISQALLITLPYLWALAVTPDGFVYSGLLFNPVDQNVHLAWARQAGEGHFFFRNLFTTESLIAGERPLFFNLLAWLLGVLSAVTKIPLVWMYHILRVAFAALALWLFYALCAKLTKDARVRIAALALAAFSGGAGYLQSLLPSIGWMDRPDDPVSPMVPEAFTFASSYIFTLNVAAFALLCAIYLLVLSNHETGSRRAAVGAGACALLLANIHTYDVFPLWLTLGLWSLWQWQSTPGSDNEVEKDVKNDVEVKAGSTPSPSAGHARWLYLPCVFVGALIPVAYQLFVFRGSEEFRLKALTVTPPPPLGHIVFSYGPLFVLAVAGAIIAWRKPQTRLPICWTLATLLIIYAPVSFARKMIEGLHLPLCFLAAIGLVAVLAKLPTRLSRAVAGLGVLLMLSVTSGYLVQWSLENAQDNNISRAASLMPPLYITKSDQQALDFLETQPRGKVVLSLPWIGNYVPRESGQTAYIGHWAETLRFENKLTPISRFYKGEMSAQEAKNWLRENRINYVFVGTYETGFGARLPLELPIVYEKDSATIYAVPS